MSENSLDQLPVVHYEIISKKPTQDEVSKLTQITLTEKKASSAEKKENFRIIRIFIIITLILGVAGSIMLLSESPVGAYCLLGAFGGIIGILVFALHGKRSVLQTDWSEAFKYAFNSYYLGATDNGSFGFSWGSRFGKIDFAVSALGRILPDEMNYSEKDSSLYLTNFRNFLVEGMELTASKIRKEDNWEEHYPEIKIDIINSENIYDGILEVKATIIYNDVLARDHKDGKVRLTAGAILALNTDYILVQSGKYWFPYDIYPEIICKT
jgi:hypothetical protein